MSACVSPPQESVSHIVQVAAIIAHAASTALPPFWKIIAPAVAASGLPVTASHFFAWSGGLFVAARARAAPRKATAKGANRVLVFIRPPRPGEIVSRRAVTSGGRTPRRAGRRVDSGLSVRFGGREGT